MEGSEKEIVLRRQGRRRRGEERKGREEEGEGYRQKEKKAETQLTFMEYLRQAFAYVILC